MIIVYAYYGPRKAVLDDVIVQSPHAAYWVHLGDRLVRYLVVRDLTDDSRCPCLPGDGSLRRVREDVRQECVGGDVDCMFPNSAYRSAPTNRDVEDDEPVGKIGTKVTSDMVVRPCMRHGVLQDGGAKNEPSRWDILFIQVKECTVDRVDILHDKFREVSRVFITQVNFVAGVQKL
jgi:hypothetical protein